MRYGKPVVPTRIPPVPDQNKDEYSPRLNAVIDPLHILKAIENAFAYADDAPCGVTGVVFPHYKIIVKKGKDFEWRIQCQFREPLRSSKRTRRKRK